MKLKRAIGAIVLVSAFASPVAAGTFEDAVDAHARGDYAKALHTRVEVGSATTSSLAEAPIAVLMTAMGHA